MDKTSVNWSGPMPAVTTPFDAKGRIDRPAFRENIARLMKAGATGVVACGCTGEFWSLSADEKKQLYADAVAAVKGKSGKGAGTCIVGVGCVGPADTIALAHEAKAAGADGVLVLPPYFVKLSDAEIYAHYKAVNAAVTLPIMVYNIPGNAVNAVTPMLADRLADLDKVVAIKESSGDWNTFYGTMIAVKDRLRVFCGPSSVFGAPAVSLGADGTVDCFPNVWSGCLDIYHATKAGKTKKAEELQETGRRMTDLYITGGRTLYPATKAAMDMQGFAGGGRPRAPLQPLRGEPLKGLRRGMIDLGVMAG
jgi:dihydrodipicolinate synthase/N-acetylneuraminate lyase